MIRLNMLAVVGMLALAGGCGDDSPHRLNPGKVDPLLVEMPNDIAVRNAIVRQETLYPYHFVVGGAALNDLGRSDLGILATHYKECPGRLSIRRGDATDELYEARVQEVLSVLGQRGVNMDRASIVDSPARGDGIATEKVLTIEAPGKPGLPAVTPNYSGMNAGEPQ
jgi:hypothetical protein